MNTISQTSRASGHVAHDRATPNARDPPTHPPVTKTKFGICRCPGCGQHWSGLSWGAACPHCGTVRMHEGNWWPWGESR